MNTVKPENDSGTQYMIGIRTYFSIQHLQSAWIFSRRAKQLEHSYKESEFKNIYLDHRSSVLGALILTVSFLESNINEFYADISDNMFHSYEGLDPKKAILIKKQWEKGNPRTARSPILKKYEVALGMLSDSTFEKDKAPFQNVNALIKLRNSLVHYESEWVFSNKRRLHMQEKSLKGKFPLNPIAGEGNRFFPDKCLGYGCAAWSLKNSLDFVFSFYRKGLIRPHNYDSLVYVSDNLV